MIPKNDGYSPFQCTLFIFNGPSKLDLMLALFDHCSYPGGTPNERILRFVTKESAVFPEYREILVDFNLLKVERSGADYEGWILLGTAYADRKKSDVRILYRTDTRKGELRKV